MPKGGKIARTAMDELKEYANALAPQKGMFSTLDELVQQAPFEQGTPEQWLGYLKPGRMLKREGIEFPLKKEELDYAMPKDLSPGAIDPIDMDSRSLMKDALLSAIRKTRPEFALSLGATGKDPNWKAFSSTEAPRTYESYAKYGPEKDPRLSHQSPDSTYEESMTRLAGLNVPNHFEPDTMSWARTSSHNLPSGEKMRLIEEIQSDLHQKAAEKIGDEDSQSGRKEVLQVTGHWDAFSELTKQIRQLSEDRHALQMSPDRDVPRIEEHTRQLKALAAKQQDLVDQAFEERPRRGYITPEELAEFRELDKKRLHFPDDEEGTNLDWTPAMRDRRDALAAKLNYGVPDAPFKDPREYASLELRKQLLNAAHNDEDYLALTRGSDQRERYGGAGEGTEYFYDKLYPSEMAKLAKRYGAEMTEVPLETSSGIDVRPEIMQAAGAEDYREFMDHVESGRHFDNNDPYAELIWQLTPSGTHDHPTSIRALNAHRDYEKARASGEDASDELMDFDDALGTLYHEYMEANGGDAKQTKTFPAIKLTPEVRERIKKAGVPLWAVGAGAVGLEALDHPDDASAEEVPHTTGGGFAEGGSVDAGQSLADLVRASQNLMASHRAPDPYRDPRLFDRFLNSYQGQWTGFDPSTGDISSMLDLTPTAPAPGPEPAFRRHRSAGPLVTANATLREPAISLGLRTLPEQLRASFKGEGLSEHPSAALEHLNAIESKMLEKDHLDAPEGLAENLFSNAGVVASQLPVPGDLISKGVAKLPAAARLALKAPAAVADFFGPTVHPTPRTIAEGAAAGTALGAGIGSWVDSMNSDDPWALAAAAVKKNQLPGDLAFQVANHLKPQPQDTPPSETETPKGLLKAGNIEAFDRPILENDDGSYSTTSSMSIGTDEGEVLIPTVVDGVRLSKEDAIAHYHKTGEHLGIFSSAEDADAFADDLHNRQEKYIEDKAFAESF